MQYCNILWQFCLSKTNDKWLQSSCRYNASNCKYKSLSTSIIYVPTSQMLSRISCWKRVQSVGLIRILTAWLLRFVGRGIVEAKQRCRASLTGNYSLTVTYCAGHALTFFKSSLPPHPIFQFVRSFLFLRSI